MSDLHLEVIQAQLAMAKESIKVAHIAIATVERILGASAQVMPAPPEEESEEPDMPAPSTAPVTSPEVQGNSPVPMGTVTPAECPHPREKSIPARTMGHPSRYFCHECGSNYDRT